MPPSATEPSPEAIAQFKRLFNAARNEHAKNGTSASESTPAHQRALVWAKEHSIEAGEILLEAYLAGWQGRADEGLAILEAKGTAWPTYLRGQFDHVRGVLLSRLARKDEAVVAYTKALSDPGYDVPVDALVNLGLISQEQGEYTRAIEYFQKAHDVAGGSSAEALTGLGDCYVDTGDPDRAIEYYDRALKANPTFQGHVLQGLGVAYRRKGEPDRALEYFENAFKAEGGDKGSILNNLGATHYEKENFDRAIEYWNQAIAEGTYKHPWVALHNLGVGYSAKGELEPALEFYKEAKASAAGRDVAILEETLNNMALIYAARGEVDLALETLEEVLAQPDRNQQHERAKNIRTQVLAQKAKIKPSREDESLVAATTTSGSASETPESRMKQKLLGKEDKYSDYLKKENSKRENTFSVLRGWSSAVTLLEGGTLKQWRGGGYFLKWGGRGLVLDPGFDFIDNFHDAGFHTREVDAVVVSHNHPDHNFDLTSLDDLRFEIFRRDLKALPDKTTVPALPPTLFAIDEDTAVVFKDDSPKHRGRPVRFSGSDYERKRWLDRENGLPFRIEHFPVQHGKDVPNAVGIRLVLYDPKGGKDFVIGYTGDTKYFADEGAPTLADQLRGCHLLLAHISQPMTQEFDDPTFPKPIHLGYNGVANLVNEVKPRLTLIGEFWAGLADLRLDLIQGLRRRCATDAILPTGLGFHLSVPSLEVECTRCRAPVAFPQIKVAPPTTPFGPLGYLCPKCLV